MVDELPGMDYGRMISASEQESDALQGVIGVLGAQIHGDLASTCDLLFAGFGAEQVAGQTEMLGGHFLDVFDGHSGRRASDLVAEHFFRQVQRDFGTMERRKSKQADQGALEFPDI